ncbi:MAG TPA: MFS transporter [Candidatus Dormibacteraeota bacterium]|nr:MFS transporter [Candidatus Dormibacteraeota bacterium]
MAQLETHRGSIADRMDRLPFSSFHRNFLLMITAGEWVETLMLLGNGVLLALVARVLGFSTEVATYVIPVSFFAGEFVGSIVCGYIADRRGRKTVFLFNLLVYGIAMLIAGFMSISYVLAILVFIAGIGVGGEFPLVDTYTSEVVPARLRGRGMAAVYTVAVTAAPLIAFLAYLVSHPSPGPYSWRILFWLMGVCAIAVWLVRLTLPESPRWYEIRGRLDDAERVMSQIEEQVMKEHNLSTLPSVESSLSIAPTPSRYLDIFAPDLRSRTIMMLVFQFFQTGIFYGFTSLAPTFLLHKGINLVHTLLFSMIIYAGFFFGSIANLFIIDRIERKWGIVGSAVIAGILGTAFALIPNVTATVVLGFLVTFTLWNFSNFLHTYQAEIFPTRVRSSAAGTVYSVSRISTSILVLLISAVFLPRGLVATFGIIWVFIAIVALDVGLFGPRSSRLRLEEIAR